MIGDDLGSLKPDGPRQIQVDVPDSVEAES